VPPLTNKRILITRTRHQASDLATQLEALGATPILIPTIEIIPPETYAPLDAAIANLDAYDWLIFTSANAVEAFHQRHQSQPATTPGAWDSRTWVSTTPESPFPGNVSSGDDQIRVPHLRDSFIVDKPGSPPACWWGGMVGNRESDTLSSPAAQKTTENPNPNFPRIAVIGPATARAAQSIGLQVDLIPARYIAESLAESLLPEAPNKSFLLIRAAEARDHLPETLRSAGATVTIAEAYRNQIPSESIPALQSLFSHPANYPDAITFTSASTARNLIALLETANLTLPPNITLASIGPITSQTLRDLGHEPTIEAPEPTIEALIRSLLPHPK
jgi:uroporphyrinogen-III synthase